MQLSAKASAQAKPHSAPYKLWDDRGLYLLVVPKGVPRWRFNYRLEGKNIRRQHSYMGRNSPIAFEAKVA